MTITLNVIFRIRPHVTSHQVASGARHAARQMSSRFHRDFIPNRHHRDIITIRHHRIKSLKTEDFRVAAIERRWVNYKASGKRKSLMPQRELQHKAFFVYVVFGASDGHAVTLSESVIFRTNEVVSEHSTFALLG